MKNCRVSFVSFAAIVGTMACAQIINPSFEADVAGAQNLTAGTPITGWSTNGTGQGSWDIRGPFGFGVWEPFWTQTAPDGNQIAYINDGAAAQQTGFRVIEGVQTLSVMAGNRADAWVSADFTIQLWAGGTVSNGDVVGGRFLASHLVQMATITPGTFSPFSVSYTAGALDSSLGNLISVRLANFSGHQINVDDVDLQFAPVPEPASMVALTIGLVALARRRRSR